MDMKKTLLSLLALAVTVPLLSACSNSSPVRVADQPVTALSDTAGEATQAAQATEATGAQDTRPALNWSGNLTVDGQKYRYQSQYDTVLFLGIDSRDTEQLDKEGVGTGGRSDTIILLQIDPQAQTIQPITLSRDTMTKVDVYDRDRNFLFSGRMQLNMQYSFGDNPKRSCLLSKKKVSEVLLGLPIDSYCSLTLDGILAAADAMGGVTLTLEDDWTDIAPSYTAGTTITMQGEPLERFLRYRDTTETGSNNVRMQRHGWFIREMFSQMGKLGTSGAEKLLEQLDPYLESDMDADTISRLVSYRMSDEVLNVPGETVHGKAHDEYNIDEDALYQFLLELYYAPVEE